ncbi:MAG: hypothetical protein U1E60_00255 [Reyranellaceae bacterium]
MMHKAGDGRRNLDRSFAEPEGLRRAGVGDVQGLGGSSWRNGL